MSARSLRLDADEMRRTGYAVVDLLVEALSEPGAPVRRLRASELDPELAAPPPDAPRPAAEILAHVRDGLIPATARGDHPGFFGFIPYCGTWPGALADFVASALNIDASTWMIGAGATTVELGLLRWLCDVVGYPPGAGGLFVSGGSTANLSALAVARDHVAGAMSERLVLYVSDQCHSSVTRAARTLGFRADRVRLVATDAASRLRLDDLAGAIERDERAGRVPLAVVANAGTTSTGGIDPLADLASLCREHRTWLHVDAAYGGGAAVTARGRALLRGIEQADSITLDPHKWLYQPFELGCLLVRDERLLERAFAMRADYLQDTMEDVNLADRGLQLTRSARALKLWWSLRAFGVDAFREAVDHSLDLAAAAVERVESHPRLELLAPPSLGIVCFRRVVPGADEADHEAVNAALIAALEQTGTALVTSTRVEGSYALRLCVMNDTSELADVEAVIAFLGDATPAAPDPGGGDEGLHDATPSELRALAVLDGLDDEALAWVCELGQTRRLPAGAALADGGDLSRDVLLALDAAPATTVRVLALPLSSVDAIAGRFPAVAARLVSQQRMR
jgi:glutamate/tyrosine decarboxylase-like PLP-dependent enzyme